MKFFQKNVMLSLRFGMCLQVFSSNTVPVKTPRVPYFIINYVTYKQTMVPLSTGSVPPWPQALDLEEPVIDLAIQKAGKERVKNVVMYVVTEERFWASSEEALAWSNVVGLVTHLFRARLSPYQAILHPAAHIICLCSENQPWVFIIQ